MADIVFTSGPDSRIIFDETDPERIAKLLHDNGVETVVVKLADHGAYASAASQTASSPMIRTTVEDPTGAGDSFAAAFLATQLKGWKLKDSLQAASATAALVVTVRGDYENIPDLDALQKFLDSERGRTEYLR